MRKKIIKQKKPIPNGVQIRKSFDLSVLVKYSYYFPGGGGASCRAAMIR